MANILEVIINGDAKGLNQSLSSASAKLKAFGRQTTDIGKRLSTRLTLPIGLAGAAAVKSASNFEKLQTSLNVLTGGAEQGAKAFERLVQFSAKTPFQLGDLAAVNNQLIGFGMSTDDAFDSLKLLGDVSAVAGADLTRVAVAFGQSAAAGRVMQQDINQFINNGIPIYKILNGVTGASVDQLRKMGSEGKITFDLLKQGFIKATSEGGQFENGMQKLSQTFAGQFSTLKDNLNIALAKFGKILLPILKDLMASFTSLIQRLSNLDSDTQRLILTIAGLAAIIPPLLIALGSVATGFGVITGAVGTLTTVMAANPIGAIAIAVTALTTAFIELLHQMNPVVSRIQTFFNFLKSGGSPARFAALQAKTMAEALKLQNEELKENNDETEKSVDNTKKSSKANVKSSRAVVTLANSLGKLPGVTKLAHDGLKKIPIEMEYIGTVTDRLSQSTMKLAMTIGDTLVNSFEGLMNGENFFQSVIRGLMALTKRLAAAAAAAAVLALLLPGGSGKVARGMSFGQKFQQLFSGFTGFADGGIVSAPTLGLMGEYPGARSNPEVIAPLDKLKSMIGGGQTNVNITGGFKLEGQDLVLALQRADRNRTRIL
jgi:tape measure domain-containing protein